MQQFGGLDFGALTSGAYRWSLGQKLYRDFVAVAEFQARAQPLVDYLGKHGPAIANQAFLQRVRAFLTRRQSSYRWLAGEIEQTREALRQTQESVGRVTRIAPVYGSAVAPVASPQAPSPCRSCVFQPSPEAPSARSPEAEKAPSGSRTLTERRRDAAEIMVLQAEAEHNAGNDAAALRLLMEHGELPTSRKAAERRSKLLREIQSR